MDGSAEDRILKLGIWTGKVRIEPLDGGMTNRNFRVTDARRTVAVRFGDDIGVHMIRRDNELAASRAAHAAGVSPEVIHHAPGAIVFAYIEGRTLAPEDIREASTLERIVPLVRKCHHDVPKFLRGPATIFWVFHVIRDYGHTLRAADPASGRGVDRLISVAEDLERAAGPFDIVFGHNDLLAANFLDDGKRLWLIDWDYAGFNTPLFDLGGLASNNAFSPELERTLLEAYFGAPVSDGHFRRYHAMKCASLLRETMWSMVSEHHSKIDFDYAAYTAENRARFEAAYSHFQQMT